MPYTLCPILRPAREAEGLSTSYPLPITHAPLPITPYPLPILKFLSANP